MELVVKVPQDLASVVMSQVESWTAELGVLSRDPTVRKFLDLQEKIQQADDLIAEDASPTLSARSWPFDPYDAFEFARELFGKEVSTLSLSKMVYGRFPDLSDGGRQLMVHLLIDNGFAEVTRKTASGRPTWYRFAQPDGDGAENTGQRLGVPASELSEFKARDLENVIALRLDAAVRERRVAEP
jgi:hypothetical protein